MPVLPRRQARRAGASEARAKKLKQNIIKAAEVIGKFYKAGIPVVAGTDNFAPGFGLFLEIESYNKLGGLTPLEAIRTATIVPAKAMGMDDVANGPMGRADLISLSG